MVMKQKALLFRLTVLVAAMMCALGASAQEASYACYTSSNTTLTFYYDNQRSSRTGETYSLNMGSSMPGWESAGKNAEVTKVVFAPSFADARPTTTFDWFYLMKNLTTIEGMEYLNTSAVTNMEYMFSGCSKLRTICVGDSWTTSAVTSSTNMFSGCTSLLGGMGTTWYSSNPKDKTYAHIDGGPSNPGYFTRVGPPATYPYACYTPENTTLTFYYDNQRSSRTGETYSLNTGAIHTGWKDDGTYSNVTKVVFDPSFANARPTTTFGWFYKMENLQSITGMSYLNTSNVTRLDCMFWECKKLTSLDLSGFNTSKVTNMYRVFKDCTNLQTIYVGSGWSTAAVINASNMFENCTSLVGGQGTTFDGYHTGIDYAHIDGGPSNPGYFTDIQDIIVSIFEVDGIYYKIEAHDVLVTHDGTGQYGCYSGTVEIPEKVYYEPDSCWYTVGGIDERAFYRCPYLQHLILPNSIGIIHNEAFEDAFWDASNSTITCMALTPPLISPSAPDPYNAPEMTLYVPYGTRSAYQAINAWNQFGNIVELNYSFKKNGIYYKITGEGTVSVTYKDGNYNTYSGRIVIPRTVAFDGVAYTVTAIDHLAFLNCPNLTDVVIPETVTAIGNTAFKNCTSLTSITIPNSVTSMGMYAFQNCTSLTDVVIGSGMTSIGAMAFNGCEDLDRGTITCLAQVPPTINSQNTFDGGHYDYTVLYVPQSAYADYQQAQYWGNFYDIRGIWSLDDALNDDGGSIHFESTGDYPWKVVSGGSARHYAESGNAGVASTTSTLTATVDVPESGATLSFVFKAWGEGNEEERIYDACTFYIDDSARLEYGEYQNDWESYSVDLEAGTHTLEWSYSKDGSADPDGDYFAIDDVKLTPKQSVKRGDVNGDSSVNISDVTALIDYLLTGNASGINLSAADCNQDSSINISDVTALIDYMLTGSW